MHVISGFDRIGEENAFAVLARANALKAAGRDVINLGIGQPDFKTPGHIVEAAIKALRDGHHGYTATTGIPELREAVAMEIERTRGIAADPERVLIVPGGKVTMFAAIMMFGEPGADILYPDPGFPIYRSMIDYTGARAVPVPIREANGFAFSADELISLITDKTRLIILNSPANPTGGVTGANEVERLVTALADRPDIAFLSDEIYGRMLYDGEVHVSPFAYEAIRDRVIILDGWSKTYAMTGWRMGWSYWPEELYDNVRKLAVNAWPCVNSSAQFAGLAALTGPQNEPDEMLIAFDARRKRVFELINAIDGLSCIMPKGAFYAFVNVTKVTDDAKAMARQILEDTGVATVGGPDFGVYGEGYIRLSYAASMAEIEEAIGRIGKWVEEHKS